MISSIQNIDSAGTFQVPLLIPDTTKQVGFTFEQATGTVQTDTVSVALSVFDKPASGHFVQQKEVLFNFITHPQDYSGWVTAFFLGLLMLLTLIWYFFPERVLRLLSREGSKHKLKYSDNQFAKPGVFLYSLYLITFISTISAFVFLLLKNRFPELIADYSISFLMIAFPVATAIYFLLRFLFIYLSGFLFKTADLASKQIRENFRIDLIQSFLLIPILIVITNTSYTYILYAGLFLIAVVVGYKWMLTIIIGLKSSKISLYHNILYLCALEIIPVIVLLKLMENYQIVF